MKIKEIVRAARGTLVTGDADREIYLSMVSTDTRAIRRGGVFIALKGPNFNGARFARAAFAKGAAGIITDHLPRAKVPARGVVIRVGDTLAALQSIARRHRERFTIPIVAVTGSNGKTTTKEMIASVLARSYHLLKNEGTKNNHIGVPQTLLKLNPLHEIAVLELGTNHPGEIRTLARICRPTAAVITNIGPSHLEFLKDLNGVCREKRDVMRYLPARGPVFVNGDDRYLARIRSGRCRIIRFGLGPDNDIQATDISARRGAISFRVNAGPRRRGRRSFRLKVIGMHNVYNALAAIAVGRHFKVSDTAIASALAAYRPERRRLAVSRARDVDIIDDSYNSNPLSMIAALEALTSYPARSRWVACADMLELGARARGYHEKIGEFIGHSDIDGLLALGPLSRHTIARARACGFEPAAARHCRSHTEIAKILAHVTRPGDVILVKGSRGMKMERVIEKFRKK